MISIEQLKSGTDAERVGCGFDSVGIAATNRAERCFDNHDHASLGDKTKGSGAENEIGNVKISVTSTETLTRCWVVILSKKKGSKKKGSKKKSKKNETGPLIGNCKEANWTCPFYLRLG